MVEPSQRRAARSRQGGGLRVAGHDGAEPASPAESRSTAAVGVGPDVPFLAADRGAHGPDRGRNRRHRARRVRRSRDLNVESVRPSFSVSSRAGTFESDGGCRSRPPKSIMMVPGPLSSASLCGPLRRVRRAPSRAYRGTIPRGGAWPAGRRRDKRGASQGQGRTRYSRPRDRSGSAAAQGTRVRAASEDQGTRDGPRTIDEAARVSSYRRELASGGSASTTHGYSVTFYTGVHATRSRSSA